MAAVLISTLFIAIGLTMDAFSVSLAGGLFGFFPVCDAINRLCDRYSDYEPYYAVRVLNSVFPVSVCRREDDL